MIAALRPLRLRNSLTARTALFVPAVAAVAAAAAAPLPRITLRSVNPFLTRTSAFSSSSSTNYVNQVKNASQTEIYSGPIAKAIQALKRVSVTSLVLTWATTPVFWYSATYGTGNASTAAIAVMVGALVVSSLSTSLIHWCVKPYVTRITATSTTHPRTLTLTRFNFIGNAYETRLQETELRPSSGRMFTTWESGPSDSNRKELFYIHTEGIEKGTEMGEIVDGVLKRAVLASATSASYNGDSASGQDANRHGDGRKEEDWDEVVKRLRKGDKN